MRLAVNYQHNHGTYSDARTPGSDASRLVRVGCVRGVSPVPQSRGAQVRHGRFNARSGLNLVIGKPGGGRARHRGRIRIASRPKAAAAALAGARTARDTHDMTTPPAAAPTDAPRYRAELLRASAKFDCLGFAAMARCC